MDNDEGPWTQKPKYRRWGVPKGPLLWLGLMLAVGVSIWGLFILFPGRLTSRESYVDFVRLFALLALISSGLIFARQIKIGEVVRNISIWTGVAAVLLLGYTYRSDLAEIFDRVRTELIPGQAVIGKGNSVVITANMDGHFYVNGHVNGKSVYLMIDTGASDVMLSPQDASRVGLGSDQLSFTRVYNTANGIGYGAPVRLESLKLGSIEFRDFKASVNKADMDHSLLGMSFLERLESFEFRGNKLHLRK